MSCVKPNNFMRYIKIIILTFFVAGFTSCDYTTYVAVRNYREPCRVNVTYQKYGSTFFDNDTLLLKVIGNSKLDSSLLRINTSTNSYYFIAPREKEIALNPISLGQPIKQVQVMNSSDSSWTINLWDKKGLKKLKKSGQVKTKGFIFTTSIFIENK